MRCSETLIPSGRGRRWREAAVDIGGMWSEVLADLRPVDWNNAKQRGESYCSGTEEISGYGLFQGTEFQFITFDFRLVDNLLSCIIMLKECIIDRDMSLC